jgi:hypothetical protein
MAADGISLDPVKWAENRLTDAEWEQWDRDGVRFALPSLTPSLTPSLSVSLCLCTALALCTPCC